MKNNEAIVTAAVQQNGLALQYASEEMKGDEQIVLAAVQSYLKEAPFMKGNTGNIYSFWPGLSEHMKRNSRVRQAYGL